MIAGMTIANLLGIPLGTALSHNLTWRVPFVLVALMSLLVLFYIWKWVPDIGKTEATGYKGQFHFLKTLAPWLILGATCVGNCGIFCMYSYVNPLMIKAGGFAPEALSLIMVAAGFGMVVGNITSGKLSDHYKPGMVGIHHTGLRIGSPACHLFCSPLRMVECPAGGGLHHMFSLP